MKSKAPLLTLLSSSLLLAACGGGGSSSDTSPVSQTPATPAPQTTVSLSISDAPYIVNTPYTLTWSSTNADDCDLSGAVTESVNTSGTLNVTPSELGNQTITLTCNSVSDSITIDVIPASVSIPDPIFADALTRSGYEVINGEMTIEDALSIERLCITSKVGFYGEPDANNTAVFENQFVPDGGVRCAYTDDFITDSTGLEAFTNLRTMRFEHQANEAIDLSGNPNLEFVSLWGLPLTDIDLTSNPVLNILGLSETSLTRVDTSMLPELSEVNFQHAENQTLPYTLENGTVVYGFDKLDFSENDVLNRVYVINNKLDSLSNMGLVERNGSVSEIWASENPVSELDFTDFFNLNYLILQNMENLNTLVLKNVNNGQVPFRLVVENAPNLVEIQVDDPELYEQARANGEISVDESITFIQAP